MGSNRIVVLTALPLEAAAVRDRLPPATRADLSAGTIVEQATLPGTAYSVCLVWTGSGNGQAAVVATQVIAWAQPDAVLFVGIAGRLKTDVALGDVVAVTKVMDYQGGKDAVDGFKARPETWPGGHRLLQVAHHAAATGSWRKYLPDADAHAAPNIHFKPVASGDVVKDTDASQLAVRLTSDYNDAAAIEMEAAGVARAAQHAGVELLVVRGISDPADGTKGVSDQGGWQPRAARRAAAFALGVIAELRVPEPDTQAPAADTAPPSESVVEPDWTELDRAPSFAWRADLHQPYSTEPATLELHLVPVGADARLQVARLRTLWGELAALGRARGPFGQGDAVEGGPTSEGAIAFTRAVRGGATTGLAVLRSGQRSAWEPLPRADGFAAIFDPAYLAGRLAAMLELLLAVPTLLAAQLV